MFIYPSLLWFLLLVGAVVLLHLINMFRHRRVEWAAMEFLLASYRKSRTRILFQQLLLMLLRAAAVAAVILMLAGPKLDGKFAQWFSGNGIHHIVLLDDSYSMNDRNAVQGGTPLFDDALAAVRKIAEGKSNDRFTLLKLSSPDPLLAELPLNADGLQTIQHTLQHLQPSSFANDPQTMLVAAADLVRETPNYKPVVYFLSDFRRRNWENPAETLKQIENIRQHGGSVRMIRVASSEHLNLTIEQLNLVEGIHAADIDILLDAVIANYSQKIAENVLVTLFVDDKMQSQLTIPRLAAREKTEPPLRFPVRVGSAEPHRIEVRLQPDALPDDNRRFMVLKVPDALEVLLITPPQSPNRESAAQYVRVALAPGGTKSGIRTRQEPPSFLAEKPLDPFSAIFLLDLPRIDPPAIKALENYAAKGSGIVFFAGENTDPDFVRNFLYKKGTGLFPADPVAVQNLDPDYLTKSPDVRAAVHPIFRLFGEGESPLLGSVTVERYLGIEKIADKTVNVLATLRNEAPLVLEKPFGAGRTITFLTTASPVWNNWGRGNPSYVVVMLELAAWLSKRSDKVRSLQIGDPLEVKINPAEFEEQIRVAAPSREGESAETFAAIEAAPDKEGTSSAVFAQTYLSGFYVMTLKSRTAGDQTDVRGVNVNAMEGDLRIMDVAELSDILRPIRQSLESASGFSTADSFDGEQSISDWLLYAVILFLLGETFLAGRILPPYRR
jgi:hypothetical protein